MQYRDRTEIIRQILEVANDAVNITRTKLMYNAFLSYNQLKDYLTLLIKRDLLSYDSITQTYKITEKGLRLLEFYNELDDMMRRRHNHVNNNNNLHYQYHPPPKVISWLITSNLFLRFVVLHMAIITLQQIIDERISFLKEQINEDNKPEVNKTFQVQIDAIRSVDDMEKVEFIIKEKKALLRNSKDVYESERLFAELDGLEWVQRQIARYS
jgi:predicted transcriptional regulator